MSLITCSECGKTVSDKAERCMHCGMPVAEILNAHGKGSHETVSTFLGGRLTIGILSLLWSIILFAALMAYYYLGEKYTYLYSDFEFLGIVHFLCFFIAGLAHICTCNSVKSTGCEIAVIAYGIATLSALGLGRVPYILICGCLCLLNVYFLNKLPDLRRKIDKKEFCEAERYEDSNEIKTWEEHTVCPECGKPNKPEDYTCKYCGHSYTIGEHKIVTEQGCTQMNRQKSMPDWLRIIVIFIAIILIVWVGGAMLDSLFQIE